MTWFKIEDGFLDHPKVADAGYMAAHLFVAGLCYCSRHLTDGRIPKSIVPRLTDLPKPLVSAERLVDVGLWHDHAAHFAVHDYHDYQRSAAEVERERLSARFRKRQQRSNGAGHTDVTAMSHRDIFDVTPTSRPCPGEVRLPEVEVETEVVNYKVFGVTQDVVHRLWSEAVA